MKRLWKPWCWLFGHRATVFDGVTYSIGLPFRCYRCGKEFAEIPAPPEPFGYYSDE